MIGTWSENADTFLVAFGIAGGLAFALPILLAPLAWARVFRWNLPDNTDLAVYFGRCLGAVAVALTVFVVRAGISGDDMVVLYQLLLAIFSGMTLVHIVGALQRIQPITETIEIGFWASLVVLDVLFYPG